MAIDVFVKHRTILRMLGIALPGENGRCLNTFLNCIFALLSILFPTLVTCFLIGAVVYSEYSVTARTYAITGVISSATAFFKLQILFSRRKEIKELMDATNGFRVTTRTGIWTYRLSIIYELLAATMRAISLTEVIIKRPKKLVMPFWTPFVIPETQTAAAFMFTFFQVSVMWKTLSNFPVDTLFLLLANQICHKLYILKNTMELLGAEDREEAVKRAKDILPFDSKTNDDALCRLCVEEHVAILRLINSLSKILDQLFLPMAFNSFFSILMAFFLVSQSENMIKEAGKVAPWTTAIFAQLFVACWSGELIKKRCADIHFAAYNNTWYNTKRKIKDSLRFVQAFTARPMVLRGAYVFELSLHTYETAVREVFSSFTVLYQFFNQKED